MREPNKTLYFEDDTDGGVSKHLKGASQAVLPWLGDAVVKIGIPQGWEQTILMSHKEEDSISVINNGHSVAYLPLAN